MPLSERIFLYFSSNFQCRKKYLTFFKCLITLNELFLHPFHLENITCHGKWKAILIFSPKGVFLVQNRTNKRYHWIQHIKISLGTKFYLKQNIFVFLHLIAQKWYFRSKEEHHHQIQHISANLTSLYFKTVNGVKYFHACLNQIPHIY